ncbi:DUF3592 domain-containing protein [Streptomyces sp. NPDC001165]|uniref:DUF3592 domain-containing protein n=1 Tax=Streptomyces sp. NPDC001165 TaxID=3364546 RepID=UPI003698E07C
MSNSWGVATCGAVALLLFGLAVREAVVVRRLRRAGIRTQGVVVGHTRDDYSDGFNPVPVIAFTDQQGHRVEFSPEMRGTGMNLAAGLEVQVVYERGKPRTARVVRWKHMMGPAVYMLLSAVAFAGAGVLIALKN